MTILHPLIFALLGLAIPIFSGYLWHKRQRTLRVPSVILLRAISVPHEPPRKGLARPRHFVSLLLVLLALAAAVTAVADVRRKREEPRDHIIVLDTSASMASTESDDTRLELAVRAVNDILGKLGGGDRVALVTTGAATLVRVGLTEDADRVRDALKNLTANGTSEASSLALRLADGICARSERGRIVLVSDGVGVGVPETKCPIQHVAIGGEATNAGISAFSVRDADALGLSEVHVAVTSNLGKKKRAEVAILAGRSVVDLVALDLPARGEAEQLVRLQLPPGVEISAQLRLGESDALSADDIATVPRAEGGRVRTLLVTVTDESFAAEALRLHPRVDLTTMKMGEAVPDGDPFALVVLEGLPKGGKLPPARRVVVFGLPPEAVGLEPGRTVTEPKILRWAFSDPLFRYVDLQGTEIPKATVLSSSPELTTLIETEQGSLGALHRTEDRELFYLGFAPHDSDLVLRVGYVNLMANLVEWASQETTVGDRSGVLSSTESMLDPPDDLAGTQPALTSRGPGSVPIWRWLVIGALAFLSLEVLLQTVVGGRRAAWARLVAWRKGSTSKPASAEGR